MTTSHIASVLRRRKARRDRGEALAGSALLLGAGCSATAGVLAANDMADDIRRFFHDEANPRDFPGDYAGCMSELDEGERIRYLRDRVKKASLNPAHIAIGQMVRRGFVDRVLTTNFDTLVVRACVLAGIEPAIYDYTALAHDAFSTRKAALPAVYHLHGQHYGVVHLNSDDDFRRYGACIGPLIQDTNQECVWIVVGYSGENDHVIDALERIHHFGHELYWVAYEDRMPSGRVQRILASQSNSHLVHGYDADRFFVSLARDLGCFPPEPFIAPFTYLSELIGQMTLPSDWEHSTEPLASSTAADLLAAKHRIHKIQKLVEGEPEPLAESALQSPEPHAGLIVNLSLFTRGGSPKDLADEIGKPELRTKAFATNWGPALAAVELHSAALRHCWVVCTPETRGNFEEAKRLVEAFAPGVHCDLVGIGESHSIPHVQKQIRAVYENAREVGLSPSEIVADITGGSSSLTAGMVLAAIDEDRQIQYLRQGKPLFNEEGAALTPEQIRDRRLFIGLYTSAAMVREAALRAAMA